MSHKIAFTSPASYALNCSTLLTERPLLDRPRAAREHGFASVEYWWPFDGNPTPSDDEVNTFIATLEEAEVRLTGLNFWAGDMSRGDRGMVSVKGRCTDFEKNAEIVAEIGRRTGCRDFNALYGLRQDGQSPQAQDEVAVQNLIVAAQAVEPIGGTVLLEPVSGAEGYPLKIADDALKVIDKVRASGARNIALLADFFHLAVNGDDVSAVIEKHAGGFGHIQIADAPGRGAPGTGDLPLEQWINRSYELGYRGGVGLEYKQEEETAFDWLSEAAAPAH